MEKIYKIDLEKNNIENILNSLAEEFHAITREESNTSERKYFDTFDARFLKSGFCFSQINKTFIIETNENRTIEFEQKFPPKFINDFPENSKDLLSGIIGIRALLPVVTSKCAETKFTLLNEDKKIEVRGSFLKVLLNKDEKKSEFYFITLIPLKGYTDRLLKAEKIITENFGTEINKKDLLEDYFKKSNLISLNYTDKPVFEINSGMDAYTALIQILKILTDLFTTNEFGIINDFDTEFLHDYRVAIRKTRSILGQLKKVFNSEFLEPHIVNLKTYAAATNELRDMDVYLLSKKEYMEMLPEHLHEDLNRFFIDVTRKKKRENRIVAKLFSSKTYTDDIELWKKYLNSEDSLYKGEEANINILELAKKYINKRYFKIIKQGCEIQKESLDEDFHKVRISCKKLRYLLELFSSLFSQKEVADAIKQLKIIQDCLGDFNDMCMQQEQLDKYLHSLSGLKSDNTKIAAAIGGLIFATYNKKIKFRSEFHEKFKEFVNAENKKLYERLFK